MINGLGLWMKKKTRINNNLAFLGSPDERIKKFKIKYKELWC